MKKRILTAVALFVGLIITTLLVVSAIWPVLNEVETGVTREYSDIVPLYFTADPRRVFDESAASVEKLGRFTLGSKEIATYTIHATAKGPLWGFMDDMVITIKPMTEFVAQVHVKSTSRIGKGDLGQNARNIREFFEELELRLGAVRFVPQSTTTGQKTPRLP